MATTTAKFQNGKTYKIKDTAFIQHQHSGIIHVAGTVGDEFALACHSNTGNSTVFSGVFLTKDEYEKAVEEIEGDGRYHIIEDIMQSNI